MEQTIEQALQQGVAAHKEGKLQEAERFYQAILQAHPTHPDANHNLGVLAFSLNKTEVALPLFKTALEANPKIGQFWFSYINALIKEKQFDNAKKILAEGKNKGLAGEKVDSLESQLKQITQTEESKLSKPKKKTTSKLSPKKFSKIKQKKKAKSPPLKKLNRLLKYYQNGRYEDAEKLAISFTEKFPHHNFGWKILGLVLQETGRISEALVACQKAVTSAPEDAQAHNNTGIMLRLLRRLKEAEESFKKAIALKPEFALAHKNLGVTMHLLGRLEEARVSYEKAIKIEPDVEMKHMLAGLTGETTNTAPRAYIEKLFDENASVFENYMVEGLGYKAPKIIADILVKRNSEDSLGSVLDLGCGTGLVGEEIKEFCTNLEGVDLSNSMIEQARSKNVYDKLMHGDILDYLLNEDLNFDVFISFDVFIYVGDLSDVFRLIKSRNKSKGKLVFTTEHSNEDGYVLEKSGRYSHSKKYIESLCRKFNYKLSHFEIINLRKERNHFITGGIYILEF